MIQVLHLAPVCKSVQTLFTKIEQNRGKIIEPVRAEYIMEALGVLVPCPNPPYKIGIQRKESGELRNMAGSLKRFPDRAEINYSDVYNRCWRRYIYFKEMAHLLIDTSDCHFTSDPIFLVQQLINGVDLFQDERLKSENLAYLTSIEMLLPWTLRDKMHAMAAAGKSELDIATTFLAPRKVVNLVMSEPYKELSNQANLVAATLNS